MKFLKNDGSPDFFLKYAWLSRTKSEKIGFLCRSSFYLNFVFCAQQRTKAISFSNKFYYTSFKQ